MGLTLSVTGHIRRDTDPVATAEHLYGVAGEKVSHYGQFSIDWSSSHPDWKQKEGYRDWIAVGALWGKTGAAPGLSFLYQPNRGSDVYADADYATLLFNEVTEAGRIPLISKREGNGISVERTAHCDFSSSHLEKPFDGLSGRGFKGEFRTMVRGVKSVLDRHHITVAGTRWYLAPLITPLPDRVPEDPPDVMAEKFLKTICGADLPADRYEAQIHFAFTSVQGLEFVRAFCGPKNEFLFPLVELTPEKGAKVLASVGVKSEGYYLQLSSRKELKPEFLADLETRFGTTFFPVPKPEKTQRKKK